MGKRAEKYSYRRRQEFSKMCKVIRETMKWNQYQLGIFIRSSQFVVSNFEDASERLTRSTLTRRRGRRITAAYKAIQAGTLKQGMSPTDALRTVQLSPSLRQHIVGERAEDLRDTITRAQKAKTMRVLKKKRKVTAKEKSEPRKVTVEESQEMEVEQLILEALVQVQKKTQELDKRVLLLEDGLRHIKRRIEGVLSRRPRSKEMKALLETISKYTK